MVVLLKEIASVQMGYSFRVRLDSVGSGGVAVIQMKDLAEENRVNCDALVRVGIEKLKQSHLVRAGDLIFRSRGLVTKSALLVEDPGQAIVAAPLFRVRAVRKSVMPEYLNWFINQGQAQNYFASHARGTAQQMISKEALENLEVIVPPLERQWAIVEVAELAEREQSLIRKIAGKRRQYISSVLLQSTEGE